MSHRGLHRFLLLTTATLATSAMIGCGGGSGDPTPSLRNNDELFLRVSSQVERAELKVFSGFSPPKSGPAVVFDVKDPSKALSLYEATVALKPGPVYPAGSVVNCPEDSGSTFDIDFFSASGTHLAVASVRPTGCAGGTIRLPDGTSKDFSPETVASYWGVVAKDIGVPSSKILALGAVINGKVVK